MHWVVSDVFVLKSVSHVYVEPPGLGEEGVGAGPPERPDHDDPVVHLGEGLVGLDVVCLVAVVPEHPGLQVALDLLVGGDGLQSLLVGVSLLQLFL